MIRNWSFSSYFFGKYSAYFPLAYKERLFTPSHAPQSNAEIRRVISLEKPYIGFRRQTPPKTYLMYVFMCTYIYMLINNTIYSIYIYLRHIKAFIEFLERNRQPPLWKLLGATATLGPAGTETLRDPAPS